MPTFPALNPQVKVPLRWYTGDLFQQSRHTKQCKGECDYAILSLNQNMPPFQFWVPAGSAAPNSWKIYSTDDVEVVDLVADLGLLQLVQFASQDYVIYAGDLLSSSMPQQVVYAVIVVGGISYYSDLFRPLCPALARTYVGDEIEIDMGDSLWNQGADEPWRLQDYEFYLDGSVSVAGAPTDPTLAVNGNQVANFADNLLYTYSGGSWSGAVPDCEDDDMWFDSTDGTWRVFASGEWQSSANVPAQADGTFGISFDGSSRADLEVVYSLEDLVCLGRWVRFQFTSDITSGILRFRVEDGMGNVVAQANSIGVTMAFEIEAYVEAGYILRIIGTGNSIGSILYLGYVCAEDSSDCHMKLTWTSCGNVGTLYYEDGFVNEFYLPRESYVAKQDPQLNIEAEEDAQKNVVEIFRRTDTEYSIEIGYVPWHVLDALSQVPLHDTVELVLERNMGTTRLLSPRIEHEWDDFGGDCLAYVTLLFKIEDAAVTSACCTTFDPPCREACVTARGIYGVHDVGSEVIGEIYLLTDGTYAEFLGLESEEPIDVNGFGAHTPCLSAVADTEQFTMPTVFYNGTSWGPVAIITQVDGNDCDSDPAVYSITASIMNRYSGQVQYTADGSTWVNTGVPFTRNELLGGAVVDIPATGLSVRIQVLGPDCTIGYSALSPLPCVCPEPFSFNVPEENPCGSMLIGNTGGIFLGTTQEQPEVETSVDGGPWVEFTPELSGGFWVTSDPSVPTTTRQWRFRMPLREACGWIESEVFNC